MQLGLLCIAVIATVCILDPWILLMASPCIAAFFSIRWQEPFFFTRSQLPNPPSVTFCSLCPTWLPHVVAPRGFSVQIFVPYRY
jgi:hypothetical protein